MSPMITLPISKKVKSKPFRHYEMNLGMPSHSAQDLHTTTCFACGPRNPIGLKISGNFDEKTGEVLFDYLPNVYHEGAFGAVHGGVLAAILDESQAVLCQHLGYTVMTEKLQMKYFKATPVHEEFTVNCWLSSARKKRLYTKGVIKSKTDGTIYASSSAVWYIFPNRLTRKMIYGFVSEEEHEKISLLYFLNKKRAKDIRIRLRRQLKKVFSLATTEAQSSE